MFRVADDGAIRRLTIDNPSRRNAIPFGQWRRLAELFEEFEASEQRVLIVRGAGQDFCSGADLGGNFTPGRVMDGYDEVDQVGSAARALHHVTKPTVAAVDGVAVGAGMNLALGCDIVIATGRARFSEIFVKRGLTVDFGGSWLLPRIVGMTRARELALTGRIVDASEAERIGLVSRVAAAEEFDSTVETVAGELAAGAPLAQRFIKRALSRSFEMSFEDALSLEHTSQAVLLSSDDFVEGVSAFMQKRDPDFKGR